MNAWKASWRTFRWFLLLGAAISLVTTWVFLGSGGGVGFHRWTESGWPVGFRVDVGFIGLPTLLGMLGAFLSNALIWTLVLYTVFRLGKWMESRS